MPKLSSADTPPEKSSDCLPVSTIEESGVMTRMPLVCMSIVASAFQYGWAPTLIPATTMLISPPSWVNLTIRLSAAATQSMFSVPEVVEIVLDEAALRPGEQAGQFVRVDVPTASGTQHLLAVVVQRLHRLRRRLADMQARAVARVEGDPHGALGQFAGGG